MSSDKKDSEVLNAAQMMLAFHDGLFIGESHDMSMAADFLITHMADFKAAGVTTLYMERDHQNFASSAVGEECFEKRQGEWPQNLADAEATATQEGRENGYFQVVKEAYRHGIRVIGSDYILNTAEAAKLFMSVDENGGTSWNDLGIKMAADPESLRDRDIYAAAVVRATHDEGKYIVYGGSLHSRLAGAEAKIPSAGVDDLLNIPSIDFKSEFDRKSQILTTHFSEYGIVGALTATATVAYNKVAGNISAHSVIEYSRDGTSSYVVTNYAGDRYAERDSSLTDNPERPFDKALLNRDQVGQTMRDAGVCETPPDGKIFNTLADIPNIKRMVDAQYPPNER